MVIGTTPLLQNEGKISQLIMTRVLRVKASSAGSYAARKQRSPQSEDGGIMREGSGNTLGGIPCRAMSARLKAGLFLDVSSCRENAVVQNHPVVETLQG